MTDTISHQQVTQETDESTTRPFLKIGEVARLIGVKPHVLRYWESEFPSLRPKKNPSGQRIYAKADIDTIVEIKNLLYNKRYTISGAKKMLAYPEEQTPHAPVATRRRHPIGRKQGPLSLEHTAGQELSEAMKEALIVQGLARLKKCTQELLLLLQ